MSLADISENYIVGIDEIRYRLRCSRSQLFIWRRDPSFPPVQTTKHGLKGYSWPAVVQWLLDNRHRLRRCAGRPDLDNLAASVQVSTRNDACNDPAISERENVPGRGCRTGDLRETVSCHLLIPSPPYDVAINGASLQEPDASNQ